MVGEIADPLADCYVSGLDVETVATPTYDNESTAVTLTKIARLLPAAVTAAAQAFFSSSRKIATASSLLTNYAPLNFKTVASMP